MLLFFYFENFDNWNILHIKREQQKAFLGMTSLTHTSTLAKLSIYKGTKNTVIEAVCIKLSLKI